MTWHTEQIVRSVGMLFYCVCVWLACFSLILIIAQKDFLCRFFLTLKKNVSMVNEFDREGQTFLVVVKRLRKLRIEEAQYTPKHLSYIRFEKHLNRCVKQRDENTFTTAQYVYNCIIFFFFSNKTTENYVNLKALLIDAHNQSTPL